MRAAIFLLALCACVHGHATLQPIPGGPAVGLVKLSPTDPSTKQPLQALVFYPTPKPEEGAFTAVGPYRLEAKEALPISEGTHPVVLLSHGHLGSRLGHHDLAESLARSGYIVAAVQHAGDSYDDRSAVGTDRMLLGRAYQISATLDALLADPMLGPHADPERVGVAGFSAGGYTSLLVVGAHPDFSRIKGYCERHPESDEICSLPEIKHTLTETRPTADPRVKAAFAMAPLGIFFGADAFEKVTAPIFLAWGDHDRVLLPDENAEKVRTQAKTLTELHEVKGADHWVFMAPCTQALAEDAPMICNDPEGVDRVKVHQQLNQMAKQFFDQALPAR
ncbi:MAG: prolyl oligopeptidase family serine peptidase [Myxococcaceae bacterium]